MNATVTPDSHVCLNFSLSLEDGTEVDATAPGEPWCFTLGSGAMVAGLESALVGLSAGERKQIVLAPEEAFGSRDEQAIQYLPRGDFPPGMELEPGAVVGFDLPDGEEIPGVIIDVGENHILVDLNHPLAGHTIVFDVEVVSIEPSPRKEK